MSTNWSVLSVIPIPGLRPTSLGSYLAALGLLKVLSRSWPDVRAAWREGVLHLVGGPSDRDALADVLITVADQASWLSYGREWQEDQERSTERKQRYQSSKKKDRADSSFDHPLLLWQSSVDEEKLELFAAHIAPAARGRFNPLLGTGGNSAKRAFGDGWKNATDALKCSKTSKKERPKRKNGANAADRREALDTFLDGEAAAWQAVGLNAASWFSDANKLYNSGQTPFSDGAISPWAMALACEGLVFFAGSASRRLGARTQSVGAFPFVVAATSPETAGEAGRDRGEVWAPLWSRPMTVPEVATLFARGRAEIGGRGAITPAAFAVAITRRGVDAGIEEFRRFALGKTTSANTFEPRYLGAAQVPSGLPDARADAMDRMLGLIESLPADRREGQRWRFVGLRGPIESAIVRAGSAPNDPEVATSLLDAIVSSLDRVDVNRSFREKGVSWRTLPLDWLPSLFGDNAPDVEARLALSLVSAFSADYPFALYRFGVELQKNKNYIHTKAAPARWCWRTSLLVQNLGAVLRRRLLDWENEYQHGSPPARRPISARLSDIEAWLDGDVDEALLTRWLSRLALFDWSFVPQKVTALAQPDGTRTAVRSALALYGLLHPLFDLRPVSEGGRRGKGNLLAPEAGARTPTVARRVTSLIRGGDVERIVEVARSRYAMAHAPLMRMDAPWNVVEPDRLLAALLFAVSERDRATLVYRWLRPQRQLLEVTRA